MHRLVEAEVDRSPDAVALIAGHHHLTRRELDRRADRVAHHLRSLAVGPEVLVGLCTDRSPEMVIGMLGILKAGGAYVPLDPAYPRERLALLLEDSGARVLLTQRHLADRIPAGEARVVLIDLIDLIDLAGGERPDGGALPENLPENMAYLIYTSGSTGRPKGVAIAHRSAAALIGWARGELSPDELSGMLAATSISFDLSVFEIFVPLALGGRIVLADNALALPSLPAASAVRLVNTVPSAASELLGGGLLPASVVTVCLAGEPLPAALAAGLYATGTVERVLNLYGPSEDTTYSTAAVVPKGGEQRGEQQPAIGRPIAGGRASVVDRRGTPVPPGVVGELRLAGDGLARGYLGRPELTAERFVPDPFGPFDIAPGDRSYRTGDLVRLRPGAGLDWELEYLSRIDHQVKVRGFRIELGEIETVLGRFPGLREVAVVVREDHPGDKRLVAYLVTCLEAPGERSPEAAELRSFLAERLPEPMVPAAFVALAGLPLLPNGTVDRRWLAEHGPTPDLAGGASLVAPRTPVEDLLAGIFATVLGIESVGAEADFFALGGHSLLATQMVSRVRAAFGVELPLRAVFQHPTVAGLAAEIERASSLGC
ncbi:MAG TPA: non-ribosomal peptide synthetase, partial [Thermoanaerobaculia bacterium]